MPILPDSSTFAPVLVVGPLVASAALLALSGWHRHVRIQHHARQEKARQARIAAAHIPPGMSYVRTKPSARPADRSGRIMLILIGTYAGNVGGVALLKRLAQCGLDGAIGSILYDEFDERVRERVLAQIPPVFRSRMVVTACPALAGGLGNCSPQEAMQIRGLWQPEVITGAEEACELHHERQHADPVIALVFVSQGGQASVGLPAVETIRRRSPQTRFYAISALPVDDRLLMQVKSVLDAYREAGVKGFLLGSNLLDELANDHAQVSTVVGILAAAEAADTPVELNNAFHLMFPEEPGGLLSANVYVRQLSAEVFQPDPSLEPRYCVDRGGIATTIRHALQEVEKPTYNSLGLSRDGLAPGTSRFVIVLVPVDRPALTAHEDTILLGQRLVDHDKRNYHLLFAPIVTSVDPQHPQCPVTVVSLAAVADGEQALGRIVAPVTTVSLPGTNGRSGETQRHGKEKPAYADQTRVTH